MNTYNLQNFFSFASVALADLFGRTTYHTARSFFYSLQSFLKTLLYVQKITIPFGRVINYVLEQAHLSNYTD
jgi:hypothetical protein